MLYKLIKKPHYLSCSKGCFFTEPFKTSVMKSNQHLRPLFNYYIIFLDFHDERKIPVIIPLTFWYLDFVGTTILNCFWWEFRILKACFTWTSLFTHWAIYFNGIYLRYNNKENTPKIKSIIEILLLLILTNITLPLNSCYKYYYKNDEC